MPSLLSGAARKADPLSRAIAAPSNESPSDREARLTLERDAKLRSDAIDEEINRQRLERKKEPHPVKVLLLGQSESGKSTTLKNFQLINSAKAFRAERALWKPVVQLNVVRSFRLILDAMTEAQASSSPTSPTSSSTLREYPTLTNEHLKLRTRLLPLLQVEERLMHKLTPSGSAEFEPTQLSTTTDSSSSPHLFTPSRELVVNTATQWKGAFGRLMSRTRTSSDIFSRNSSSADGVHDAEVNDPNDPAVTLQACAEDMIRLWNDPTIKSLLKIQKLRLEDMAGFFLDSLERVTTKNYMPTDDDILRARLKTVGVSEHRFTLKAGNALSHDWRIFDVGGSRCMRGLSAWAPFFDDVNAIIFLAPISCFDQALAEDSSVNRLEDSFTLWTSLVSNPLLKDADLVLFLNKCDILRAKLASGIKLSRYVVSYGDKPNDFENASTYLRKKFGGLQKQHSPRPRTFYCHFTSVIDVRSTTIILGNVRDMVIKKNLQKSELL